MIYPSLWGIPYPYQACQFSAGTGCAGVLTGRSAFRFVGTSPRCPCGGAAVEAEHARVKVAYTNMFPRLALTGQFGLESDVLSNFLESPYSLLNGAVLAPLFGWGKNRAALNAQKASFEAEVHSYEKTVLNAFKEAKNAIVDFNKIKEVYQLRAKLERSAKGYVDLAQLQYINGVINYMDVLDAQRGYFDAQIGVSNAIRDELIAMVNVYKALGGGWQTE